MLFSGMDTAANTLDFELEVGSLELSMEVGDYLGFISDVPPLEDIQPNFLDSFHASSSSSAVSIAELPRSNSGSPVPQLQDDVLQSDFAFPPLATLPPVPASSPVAGFEKRNEVDSIFTEVQQTLEALDNAAVTAGKTCESSERSSTTLSRPCSSALPPPPACMQQTLLSASRVS